MAVTNFNPIDDQDQQLVNQIPEEERLAKLREMSATDQADATFTESASSPEQTQIPQGRFEGNFKGATSAVDLSKKANVNKMWEEYDEWYRIGRNKGLIPGWVDDPVLTQQRETLRDTWYLKFYGWTYDKFDSVRRDTQKQYNDPLNNFSNKI